MQRLGIMAAVHEEIDQLLEDMAGVSTHHIGMRDYHVGNLYGHSCVIVLARMGKVAAAASTVTLLREFSVDRLVFSGLAGGVAPQVRMGDVVVGTELLQHDLDASPLFPRHEIPLLQRSRLEADEQLTRTLAAAADDYLREAWQDEIAAPARHSFGLADPRVHEGLIISGDQFINSAVKVQALSNDLPAALCVEMEGAAVAQICHEYGARFAVVRTVSDRADDSASHDFTRFLREVASHYSSGIIKRMLRMME